MKKQHDPILLHFFILSISTFSGSRFGSLL